MAKSKKTRTIHVGDAKIRTDKTHHSKWRDPYHFILTLSWPQFFATILISFLLLNVFFATLYWLIPNSINNANPDNFFDYFFFSIETLATVGYGFMSPANFLAHLVASTEIFTGMMIIALTTGLAFVRFSKPTARIMFTNNAIISEFDNQPALMIRVANERHNRIVEANAKLSLIRNELNASGENFVRIHDLTLMRERTPIFTLTWSLIHLIDKESPFYNVNADELLNTRARIIISFMGHDETMSASVYTTKTYYAADIIFNSRFADIITQDENGARMIDLTRFHDIEIYKDNSN